MSGNEIDSNQSGKHDKRLSSGQEAGKTTVVREQIDPALTREKQVQTADKIEHAPVAKRFESSLTRDKHQGSHQSAPQNLVTEQLDSALTRDKQWSPSSPPHNVNSLAKLVKDEKAGMRPHAGISGGDNASLEENLVPPSTPTAVMKATTKDTPNIH